MAINICLILLAEIIFLTQINGNRFEFVLTTTEPPTNKQNGLQEGNLICKALGENILLLQAIQLQNTQDHVVQLEKTKSTILIEIQKIIEALKEISNPSDTSCQREEFSSGIKKIQETTLNENKKQLDETRNEMKNILRKQETISNEMKNQLDESRNEMKNILRKQETISKEMKNQLAESRNEMKNVLRMQETNSNEMKNILGRLEDNEEKVLKLASIVLPKDCLEIRNGGKRVSGVYTIKPIYAKESFEVWCDMKTEEGGWTYVLNRFDGSQEFYLGWERYKNGFGDLKTEFWLGLDHLYELTVSGRNEVLFQMVDWDNKIYHAKYDNFRIGSEADGYSINSLGEYSGNAGDALRSHLKMKFSTYDNDQDVWSSQNCALTSHSGWWHWHCHHCQLTGLYFRKPEVGPKGMTWYNIHNSYKSLKEARVMVRSR